MLKFLVADLDPGSGAFVTRNGKRCFSRIRNTEIRYGTDIDYRDQLETLVSYFDEKSAILLPVYNVPYGIR
jgi:hypothetical protein